MSRATRNLIQVLRNFAHARKGATAVEFAFIAGPLLMLIFGVLELALVFMVSATLEGATASASRPMRTGQMQTGGGDKAAFGKAVCDRMSWLGSGCTSNLNVDVRTYSDFTSLRDDPSMNGGNFDPAKTCWSPGGPTDIVLVRTYYTWTVFTPLLSSALVNAPGNKRMISSVAAFRNEPYSDSPPTGAKC
ncbi:MAG: pilus assembly protein [Phenylobacterium sp.]|uniref:TadE/TadG family type IV pilus assembly protein n=1 Tax=Phenylobacterium sp. TaxID=1871053 RepID=UPI0025DA09AB|nr:TadE/TadG family type IV pilus assembly protein [Phenylobacterium sp.]MCG9916420.1 pilus assembly protein [Phenylobacterium sp.]